MQAIAVHGVDRRQTSLAAVLATKPRSEGVYNTSYSRVHSSRLLAEFSTFVSLAAKPVMSDLRCVVTSTSRRNLVL